MYGGRAIPLMAPLAAGFWVDGGGWAVLSVLGLVALLLAVRAAHLQLIT